MNAPDQSSAPWDTPPAPDGRVSDSTDRNWVDRFAPERSRPFLRLSRADRPAGTWLLLIPCWWGLALAVAADPAGGRLEDLWIAGVCAVGAFLMRGAGCTWNDITDRDIDGGVARTRSRPLPSGRVTVKQALAWMVVQALIGLLLLLTLHPAAILLGVISLAPVCVYPFMKRVTWWPQVFLGLAFNWGALLAWTAHTGALGWPAVLLYLAGIAWTLFYDTIYACCDAEDDALIGVKSTARLFAESTGRWLLGFLVAASLLSLAAAVLATAWSGGLAMGLAIAGVWAFALRLHWQLRRFDRTDGGVCLRLFRDNRNAGLLMALGFAAAALA
ncbi:4-hydroxybenzoate octaprenyltransferase [uncultured Albimonas sp.]|mgnify:FL=1|uniref:4-hydroxybenzoate octaprenyltransferase n=1 Tax=uncultured Albimonas sp. TaxID=1331701 RepID=UPI0030EDACD1|tara:strand:+ start:3978 stop:4967 length:990 start_codon:yes stop_codon:yes gene_type:complete